jgi:hypothetical protein
MKTTLEFSGKIDDEKLSQLLGEMSNVTTLEKVDLSRNQLTILYARDLVEFIKNNPCVECLDLASNHLTDDAVSLFSELPLREIQFALNPMTGSGLEPFLKNKYLLFITYSYDRSNPSCGDMVRRLDQQIDMNRKQFRADLISIFVAVAGAARQKNNYFHRLPKEIITKILIHSASDYHYASSYHASLKMQKCVEFVLDMIINNKLNKRPIMQRDNVRFFRQACNLLPLGLDAYNTEDQKDSSKKCVIA